MLSGKSFTINSRKFTKLGPRLSSPNCPLVILPLNGLLTEEYSVQAESLKMILTELPRLLEQFSRLPSTM